MKQIQRFKRWALRVQLRRNLKLRNVSGLRHVIVKNYEKGDYREKIHSLIELVFVNWHIDDLLQKKIAIA
jgi:hypothetical protein